jgi:uncharacterized protein YneF (UPF0154 family)
MDTLIAVVGVVIVVGGAVGYYLVRKHRQKQED